MSFDELNLITNYFSSYPTQFTFKKSFFLITANLMFIAVTWHLIFRKNKNNDNITEFILQKSEYCSVLLWQSMSIIMHLGLNNCLCFPKHTCYMFIIFSTQLIEDEFHFGNRLLLLLFFSSLSFSVMCGLGKYIIPVSNGLNVLVVYVSTRKVKLYQSGLSICAGFIWCSIG